jgi:hypothetical protein
MHLQLAFIFVKKNLWEKYVICSVGINNIGIHFFLE